LFLLGKVVNPGTPRVKTSWELMGWNATPPDDDHHHQNYQPVEQSPLALLRCAAQ
jgi:hypothetical protein